MPQLCHSSVIARFYDFVIGSQRGKNESSNSVHYGSVARKRASVASINAVFTMDYVKVWQVWQEVWQIGSEINLVISICYVKVWQVWQNM